MSAPSPGRFNVGGILLERPFKIRRFGHFGYNCADVEVAMTFYRDLMGFRVTDKIDFTQAFPKPHLFDGIDGTIGYFTTHSTDHHSQVIFPKRVMDRLNRRAAPPPDITTHQIAWQVGTLQEIRDGIDWFQAAGVSPGRTGRDFYGSNWHSYPPDPEGHINEIFYGIEQIGWDLLAKPAAQKRGFPTRPELPQPCEYTELQELRQMGRDLTSGFRHVEKGPFKYNVGGVLLARPFKVIKVGPVRLFVHDMQKSLAFYTKVLGLRITEEVDWEGHHCVFLRCNTEHHSLALYPITLRSVLGLSQHTTIMSVGNQVGDYAQLRNAIDYLAANGATIKYLPPELFPGTDYSACVLDPDGHATQLYYYMEQVGWDGVVRPRTQRRHVDIQHWPEVLEPMSDTFDGEAFVGPLG